ncbi:hypothetical protein HYALB_00003417, partial [Hymenoscyphus albidus]
SSKDLHSKLFIMKFSLLTLFALLPLLHASPLPQDQYPVPTHTPTAPQTPTQPNKRTAESLNQFLGVLLNDMPAIEGSLDAVTGVLTEFEGNVAALTKEPTTYNDLEGNLGSDCRTYTIVFARGTTEPGNVGILAGPPFFEAMDAVAGARNVAIQGVNNYKADIVGYLTGGSASGTVEMARQISDARAKCPNTKLIAAGYSQGGQLVHKAAALLPVDTARWISKVVIFGDPLSRFPVTNVDASRTKIFCNIGDNICDNGDLVLPPHLIYGKDALAAALFATS